MWNAGHHACVFAFLPASQLLLLVRASHRGELRAGSHAWVFYGDVWECFRSRVYWWGSIQELRKLVLILVLNVTQVWAGDRHVVCDC